jgi:hypothetical protein
VGEGYKVLLIVHLRIGCILSLGDGLFVQPFEDSCRLARASLSFRGGMIGNCATNQKVAGSNPNGVMEIFIDVNPSDRNMALGSTQPLTEMSTGSISWGKGGRCVRLTTLPPLCAVVKKSGNLNFLEPSGPFQACNGTALPSCAIVMKSGNLNFLEPSGPLQACNGTALPSCAIVMKSGNPNFLEPSGPLQACNGTALPLPLPFQ